MKITFMGAGSTVFARNVIGDCMCVPELRDSTFALYDIDGRAAQGKPDHPGGHAPDQGRLWQNRVLPGGGKPQGRPARRGLTSSTPSRWACYDPCTIIDFEVPKKYGLRQTIGDTLGIGRHHAAPCAPFPVMAGLCPGHGGGLPGRPGS